MSILHDIRSRASPRQFPIYEEWQSRRRSAIHVRHGFPLRSSAVIATDDDDTGAVAIKKSPE